MFFKYLEAIISFRNRIERLDKKIVCSKDFFRAVESEPNGSDSCIFLGARAGTGAKSALRILVAAPKP